MGEGPAIFLVHSGASDGREWRPQLDGLADEFTVVAWDEPGAGKSSDLPTGFGLADYADILAGLVGALGLAPAYVGGLSWGGVVVLELYRRHPGVVRGLILADTYAGWRGSLPAKEVEARLAAMRGDLEGQAEDYVPNIPGLFAAGAPPAEYAGLLTEIEADVRPQSMSVLIDAVACDQTDVLPAISVPTLLLWGEADVRSPLRVAQQFAGAIPDAELVVIPGAGHVSNLERPDDFNDAIRAFCRRTTGR